MSLLMRPRVHAIRDHAVKQENEHLGLPDTPQASDDKVQKFGEWLWQQRSREGRTMLELLNYVVWGHGSIAARLWNAIRSDEWAIPHIGLSSLGEIVGWARPEEFPPRNMRTSKGLGLSGTTSESAFNFSRCASPEGVAPLPDTSPSCRA